MGLARKVGLYLLIISIFKRPILKGMARSIINFSSLDEDDIAPLSLLRKDRRKLLEQAAELGRVDIARTEDIFLYSSL